MKNKKYIAVCMVLALASPAFSGSTSNEEQTFDFSGTTFTQAFEKYVSEELSAQERSACYNAQLVCKHAPQIRTRAIEDARKELAPLLLKLNKILEQQDRSSENYNE